MEHFQKELTEVALKKIVSSLRSILYRIETKDCKDVIGLLEPYMDSDSFQNIREIYLNYKNNQLKHVDDNDDNDEDDDHVDDEEFEETECNNNNNNNNNINNNNFINNFINQCNINTNNNNQAENSNNNNINENITHNISQKYLLQIQNVAARLVSPSNTAAMDGGNREHSYNRISDKSRGDNSEANGNGGARKKRRSKSGFPFNWNLIASMISNITLDQVESMIKVLIMVLSRTPINVLFKQFHEYKFIISTVYDLLNAIVRGDSKDIGANLIIAIVGVIRLTQRKNLPLIFGMEVAKYLYNSGNKKKFSLVKSVSLIAFLSNLLKLFNPPPVTPLDIIQLVKSQIQSKL